MMLGRVVATTFLAIIGLVGAQDVPATPSICATGCVTGVITNAATIGCPNGDSVCVCGKMESFLDGIRDCIRQACVADGPDAQIPLAEAYGQQTCAALGITPTSSSAAPESQPASTEAPSSTTEAPSSTAEPQPTTTDAVPSATDATPSTSEGVPVSTTASVPGTESSPPSTSVSPTENPSIATPTPTVEPSSSASSVSTSTSASPTTSNTAQPAATSGTSAPSTGLPTAAKAGIGAGVGASALAALIIAACVLLRRRQRNKTASRVRDYKISEPMSSTDRNFGNDIGRAETGLPKPIITTRREDLNPAAAPLSPTSVYSNSSELESHARRYEDMLPRTQPRTMI